LIFSIDFSTLSPGSKVFTMSSVAISQAAAAHESAKSRPSTFKLARAQSQLDGDMAEVGVYQGSSARMICTEKGAQYFCGFDAFSGLADVGEQDTHNGVRFFRAGHFAADYETTSACLKDFANVQLVKGFFPESAECIADRKFSFVHLDVDTYGSTLASMRYFWPRLVDRAIIITHDAHSDGVTRAITEFTAETGARAISSACSQMILTR
jgi:O-methyltransferase